MQVPINVPISVPIKYFNFTLPIDFDLVGLNLNLSYPYNLYVYGYTREGRVRSMGGSRMGKVVPIILKMFRLKLNIFGTFGTFGTFGSLKL